jgi:hypothetical protein
MIFALFCQHSWFRPAHDGQASSTLGSGGIAVSLESIAASTLGACYHGEAGWLVWKMLTFLPTLSQRGGEVVRREPRLHSPDASTLDRNVRSND